MMSKLDQKILDQLQELIKFGERVKRTGHTRSYAGFQVAGDAGVDSELAYEWGTSCLNLLSRVFGESSAHYKSFESKFSKFHLYSPVVRALGTLRAAQNDYKKDLLFDTRVLVEAEVFDDFLEQAEHLLDSGYYQAAAVLSGGVLEDGLRKLCIRNDIILPTNPKVDTMNADLVKHGVYTKLKQKQITVLADVRNKAAHGKWSEFDKSDVADMLHKVRQFTEEHFT